MSPDFAYTVICQWILGLLPLQSVWMTLLLTWGAKHLFESTFNSCGYPEAKSMDHRGILYLIFLEDCHITVHSGCTGPTVLPARHQGSSFSIMVFVFFFLVVVVWLVAYLKMVILMGVKKELSHRGLSFMILKTPYMGGLLVLAYFLSHLPSLLGLLGPPIQLWSTPPDWPPLGFHAPVFISCDLPGIF